MVGFFPADFAGDNSSSMGELAHGMRFGIPFIMPSRSP